MSTAYVHHELFHWHDTGTGTLFPADPATGSQPLAHVADADTKRRIHERLAVSGLIDRMERVAARTATDQELLRAHTQVHVERIRAASDQPKGGDAGDGISPFGKGGYDIAALAAGGAIRLTEAVVSGHVDNGYALINPPGHHAAADSGMGFCLFNNVAIAAKHARESLGLDRVAIVDWDVHHGNGTQAVFAEDPSVLTVSVHQDRVFPADSGLLEERGEGPGHGYNLNVPLPAGTGDGGYRYAFEHVVAPAIRKFRPDLVIVASGLDPNAMDPLARQMLTSDGFRVLTRTVMDAAEQVCRGRVVVLQEGGYTPVYVPFCGAAVVETLLDTRLMDDALLPVVGGFHGHELEPHQKAVCDQAAALVSALEPSAIPGPTEP